MLFYMATPCHTIESVASQCFYLFKNITWDIIRWKTLDESLNSVGNVLCSTSYWTKGLNEPSASYLYILSESLYADDVPNLWLDRSQSSYYSTFRVSKMVDTWTWEEISNALTAEKILSSLAAQQKRGVLCDVTLQVRCFNLDPWTIHKHFRHSHCDNLEIFCAKASLVY